MTALDWLLLAGGVVLGIALLNYLIDDEDRRG